MCPIQELKILIPETLNSDAQTIYPGPEQLLQFLIIKVIRVCLQGDLRIFFYNKIPVDLVQNSLQLTTIQQGRRSAPKINCTDALSGQIVLPQNNLLLYS